jgi:neuraminyllactose-binding hemagglutinin
MGEMGKRRSMTMARHELRLIGLALLLTAAAACAHTEVKKEVGQLNLSYATKESGKPTGRAIGIVSSVGGAPVDATETTEVSRTKGGGFANQGLRWNARADLSSTYMKRLASAMGTTFTEMLSQRGFNIKGPYTSFDEMTFGEKRDLFLVSASKLQIDITQKSTKFDCDGSICTDEGEFQVAGELNIQLLEPLTQQSVMTRRINLSDFNVSRHYKKQSKAEPTKGGSPVLSLIEGASAPSEIVDDTDKVMTEALNEFYARAMGKIDNLLSREEILSHDKDVEQLKGMKRY